MEAIISQKRTFSWEDYAVFSSMLLISAIIGVYHGFNWRRKKQKVSKDPTESNNLSETGEFLIGGGKMQTLPVALSMLASFLSSITLMGQPAEVYMFGPQIWLVGIATFLVVPIVSRYFVDFFRDLNVTSAYEYFGQRFSRPFQSFASVIFTLQMILFLALVLYAPALALHQVTGINVEFVVIVMYVVCIFYTTIGGIRAVVWTDTFQVVVLFVAMLVVLAKGTMLLGGFSVVWQRNIDNLRGDFFNFNFNPLERYSVWTALIGGSFLHLSVLCGNQLQIQRMLTVPSVREVKKMLWINAFGWTFVILLTTYAGMLIFANYFECDPLSNNVIKSADQLFPLFVMDVLSAYKGFPGLFVAGIFSAGLSTVSTGVNSLAAIWFAELDGTDFKKKLTPRKAGLTVKLLALLFGLLSFGIVFLVPFMGTLVAITISISGFFSGSLFGIFILGRYVPFANSWGAFSGLLSGTTIVGWLTVGSQIAVNNGYQVFKALPVSTSACEAVTNTTMIHKTIKEVEKELAFAPYRISFLWHSFMAILITLVVGSIVSYIIQCFSSPKIPINQMINSSYPRRVSKDLIRNVDVAFRTVHHPPEKSNFVVFVPEGRNLEPKLLDTTNSVQIV